jgi:four helix bundle protein
MRDHKKLQVFQLADELVLEAYQFTSTFPSEEKFGLSSQLRKSALSVVSNLVDGCARRSETEFLRFLDIALGSARELEYQLSVARRLGFLGDTSAEEKAVVIGKKLHALSQSIKPGRPNSDP